MLKAFAVLSVCVPLAMAQSGTVHSGTQPIPGVTVRATQGERALSTITDDNGNFQFQGMMPGTWSIEADMFGFDHFKHDAEIAAAPTRIDVALTLQARVQITQLGEDPVREAGEVREDKDAAAAAIRISRFWIWSPKRLPKLPLRRRIPPRTLSRSPAP